MLIAQQATSNEYVALIVIDIMVLITLLPTLLWIWMLVDCIQNEPEGRPERLKWIVFLAIFGPLAVVIYHSSRRKRRIKEFGR